MIDKLSLNGAGGVTRRINRDDCQICHGKKGGVKGNENVIDGIIVCDYCSAQKLSGTVEDTDNLR